LTALIFIATDWSYSHGGINSFNYDLLLNLGRLKNTLNIRVGCISYEQPKQLRLEEAKSFGVEVFTLAKQEHDIDLQKDLPAVMDIIKKFSKCQHIYFIGHDIFTGDLAIHLRNTISKSSAVIIHHMDYESYIAIKGEIAPSKLAIKFSKQTRFLKAVDAVVAIGPKLYESAISKTEKHVIQLIPGLQHIEEWPHSTNKVSAITFGRYDERTDRLKQMALAVQGFSSFLNSLEENNFHDHTIKIVGISSEQEATDLIAKNTKSSQRYLNILPLPYTEDRLELFDMLRRSNIALMLSYHEGFGLAGLEAIAGNVPLILSKNSGLYLFLSEVLKGKDLLEFGIYPVGIHASSDGTINVHDVEAVRQAIAYLHEHNGDCKEKLRTIKLKLQKEYSWTNACNLLVTHLEKVIPLPLPLKVPSKTKSTQHKKTAKANQLLDILGSKLITPFEPNLHFVARETLEIQLEQEMDNNNFLVVLGDHGMGKSSLTRNYINTHFEKYDHILWINFQNDLKQSLVFSILNSIPSPSDQVLVDIEGLYNQIIHLLNQAEGRKLLVIDNLDILEELESTILTMKLQQWKVIVTTTRDPNIIPESRKVRVNVMSHDEGYKLFQSIVGSSPTFGIERFRDMFPENQLSPFLIEYFSYYWKKELMAEKRFGEIDQENRIQTLYRYFKPEANLIDFYEIVFSREAYDFTPEELQLLGVYSLFPNNFSNVDIIREVLSIWFDVTAQNAYLRKFIESGWISRNLVIHFLRQSIILRHVKVDDRKIAEFVGYLSDKYKIVGTDNPLNKLKYLPLGYALKGKVPASEELFIMLHRMAILEFDQAKLDDAWDLQDFVAKNSNDKSLIGAALFEKGLIEERRANYIQSIDLLKESLLYRDAKSIDRVNTLSKISVVYGKIYFRDKTEVVKEQLLSHLKSGINLLTQLVEDGLISEENVDIGTIYVDSGSVLSELHDYQDLANQYFVKGISIYEVSLDPMHPWLATTYNLYGNYLTNHDLTLALDFIERSIAIRKEIFKEQPNHFNLAEGYHDYAYALYLSKQYDKALQFVEMAIEIRTAEVKASGESFRKRLQYSLDLKVKINEGINGK
jgi:glycosyltransferase involved in cell wall biosynthesis/tetratricopeptide (TPR) repeat protein